VDAEVGGEGGDVVGERADRARRVRRAPAGARAVDGEQADAGPSGHVVVGVPGPAGVRGAVDVHDDPTVRITDVVEAQPPAVG
jgi:hypothetical protein